jgi:dTDP-4-dehydrorhamnose reductase
MKILVTGANGLLGQQLVRTLLMENYRVTATGRGPCRLPYTDEALIYYDVDLTSDHAVEQMMYAEKPNVVVHAAAMTQVDDCQQQQEECMAVNVEATARLLLLAEQFASHFIFLSTDFVFNGDTGFYNEEDMPAPVSWYGFTKVQAESTVETSEIPWAIVRTCLVYGNAISGTRSNILSWVKNNLEQGKSIKVVNDQVRTPTFVDDLARGILLIIQHKATGIFNIAGKDILTPYDMAMATAEYLHLDKALIHEVDASVFSQPGRRPLKTGFDITKARTVLGFEPLSFEEGLRRVMDIG